MAWHGMYLLNSLSIHLAQAALSRVGLLYPLFAFPLGLGLTVGVAYLSYRFLETAFLELKKKRFSPLAKKEAAAAPPHQMERPIEAAAIRST